jgi:iron-sulfur cluster repair protein YtfE (RIC family)
MKATELLKKDHRTAERLFSDYEALGDFPEEKKELVQKIRKELEIHAQIEEQVFYPALKDVQSSEAGYPVSEALQEHGRIQELLNELSQLEPEDDEFDNRVQELRKNVERHVLEEEGEMFPQALDEMTDDRLEQLGARMEEIRQNLLRGPRYRKTG